MPDDPELQALETAQPHLTIYPIAIEGNVLVKPLGSMALVDQFDDPRKPRYTVRPLAKFAPPAQKFPAGREPAEIAKEPALSFQHYTWYPVVPRPAGRVTPPGFRVEVRNQFGIEIFDICLAEALLVPAAKRHQSITYPALPGATHFKVYPITLPTERTAKESIYYLRDQFTIQRHEGYPVRHRVLAPVFFAVPCDKASELRSGDAHLLIYTISPERDLYKPVELSVKDQFGTYRLDLEWPEYLAVPTLKVHFIRIEEA
jgi:hypothetical protein